MHDEDRLGVLITPAAVAELAASFGGTEYVQAVQAFRGVRMLSHRMSEASADWLAPHEITVAQYNFLAVLFLHDRNVGVSSRDIGKFLHTTSGTVTSMTDTLERLGLIKRAAHPSDKRSILIKLTPKGRRHYVAAARTHHERVISALGDLSGRDLKTFLDLLVRAGNSLSDFLAAAAAEKEAG